MSKDHAKGSFGMQDEGPMAGHISETPLSRRPLPNLASPIELRCLSRFSRGQRRAGRQVRSPLKQRAYGNCAWARVRRKSAHM